MQAMKDQKAMGFVESFRLHRKAVFWSITLSTCIVMEGFDLIILDSLYALPEFQGQFGTLQPDGSCRITTRWQTILSSVSLMIEKVFYKKTLIAALILLAGAVTTPFLAQRLWTLALGQVLCGMLWCVFETTTIIYASEVTPVAHRPLLTTYRTLTLTTEESYKIPFATQWIWTLLLIAAISFALEPPWWLIRQDHPEDAKRQLFKLRRNEIICNVWAKLVKSCLYLMSLLGRRMLYLAGQAIGLLILVAMGLTALALKGELASWASGSMLLAFTFFYDATVGPVCYALVPELSIRLLFLQECGLIYAGTAAIMLIWTWFRLPETKHRTFYELDLLFDDNVSARGFAAKDISLSSRTDETSQGGGGYSLTTRKTGNKSQIASNTGKGQVSYRENGQIKVENVVTVTEEQVHGGTKT
ncbi:hypothetical protein BDZ85DRAFT_290937 [Elsinoe ampelina]|uniref:Major facilitator superfamily domain-containing protein n=1 Tax=Elsinoe ampelina TaxID=302913 RepID=A0A6A6G6A0_9PEZI|nr:hypothetical protein BDZ85DRAFT_290937 [Elsinoe ampelina]